MRVLIYKRTHTGDPDERGIFGIHDCMGSVRGRHYGAVVGIGGLGSEAQAYDIDGRITWIGVGPKKRVFEGYRGPIVTFEQFILFDESGPDFRIVAPHLASRIYDGKVRYMLPELDGEHSRELNRLLNWTAANASGLDTDRTVEFDGFKAKCPSAPTKRAITAACSRRILKP